MKTEVSSVVKKSVKKLVKKFFKEQKNSDSFEGVSERVIFDAFVLYLNSEWNPSMSSQENQKRIYTLTLFLREATEIPEIIYDMFGVKIIPKDEDNPVPWDTTIEVTRSRKMIELSGGFGESGYGYMTVGIPKGRFDDEYIVRIEVPDNRFEEVKEELALSHITWGEEG